MSNYLKKIISCLLIICLIAGVAGIPEKAHAQLATVEATGFARLIQNIQQSASSLATQFSTYSLQYKAFVLDTLATTLAKQLIRQITASVVNWINSGFEGSPSFMTNPGSFFLDVADQVTGEFLARAGGPLTQLCSPFSIDIRLALAFKYHPNIQKRYTCTLGAIIKNSRNANISVNGKSIGNINGFMNGDFAQGGWPAFVSLTTEPQNNIYGAYLQADSELSIRVANAQLAKKDEISNGKGFLSWRNPKCSADVKTHNAAVNAKYQAAYAATNNSANYDSPDYQYNPSGAPIIAPTVGGPASYNEAVAIVNAGGDTADSTLQSVSSCPIETPGSLIVSNLETSINGPLHELELVDSINEIVNALAAQLVTQVLQTGLRAVSGSGPSDSTSYLNQIQKEANNANTAQVNTARNSFISSVEKYINDTLQYKTNKDQSLNLIIDAKNTYDSAKACYVGKTVNSQNQAKIAEINSTIETRITPVATRLLASAKEADDRYKTLTDIRDQANAAKTVNDLNIPSQKFAQMLQDQTLITAKDILASQQELDETKVLVAPMKQDAQRKLQECQISP